MDNPMHKRFLAFLLAMGIALGGLTPAFSFSFLGCTCVASAGCPTESSGTKGDGSPSMPMPCKAMSEQCMNSVGCIELLGLPSAIQTAQVDPPALRYQLVGVDMAGRTPKPELAPPILAA
ncbi:MAG TPA: hypothetical protein VGB82_05300 [Alphaproteobacteria bacterium]